MRDRAASGQQLPASSFRLLEVSLTSLAHPPGVAIAMTVELSPDAQKQALASLRRFCTEELEVELTEVQTLQLLKFVLKEIAPTVHNAGVASAEAYLRDRLADLEGVCHVPEFTYWPKGSSGRRK
jgi:uncharacterized protein (DUF2164 family)